MSVRSLHLTTSPTAKGPSVHLLRALLLQVRYSVRSERMLIEQLQYNLRFRWFVGIGVDDAVWAPTTFTMNRDWLLDGDGRHEPPLYRDLTACPLVNA